MGLFRRVIFTGDECPFKENTAAAFFAVVAAGGDQFLQGVASGEGNERLPFSVGRAMQTDGEAHGPFFVGQAANAGHKADGAEGDVFGGDGQPIVVHDDVQGFHGRVVVVQGFAHAHEDDIAQVPGRAGAECG